MGVIWTLRSPQTCWFFENEKEPQLPGRTLEIIRGKVLGGSSSINGTIYVRGHCGDYDEWSDLGNSGWSYSDVLPYFKRIETYERGRDFFRGDAGPVSVRGTLSDNPLYDAFIEAGLQAGHPITADYNGQFQHGMCRTQYNLYGPFLRRCSAADAYLRPAVRRPNLKIVTKAVVTKVLVQDKAATAVEFVCNGVTEQAYATSEILLAAGAFKTPQLLMLSGIGPADHLKQVGLPVIENRPGVGENLQDHFGAYVQRECIKPVTMYSRTSMWGKLTSAIEYLVAGRGPLSHYPLDASGYLKSDRSADRPDLQFYLAPFLRTRSKGSMGAGKMDRHGYCISWCHLRPSSRGRVSLVSSDPWAAPRILHNYLRTEDDRHTHRIAVEMARELHAQQAFAPFRGMELDPGASYRSNHDIDDYIREVGHSHFHPAGTAAMGRDEMAVVDAALRVHGIRKLRVVDASIMPRLVGANTHAPTLMIAERASDLILGRSLPKLVIPPSNQMKAPEDSIGSVVSTNANAN